MSDFLDLAFGSDLEDCLCNLLILAFSPEIKDCHAAEVAGAVFKKPRLRHSVG
jgi:hypothetical protein